MKITNVEELDVFKLSHVLALEIYRVSKDFPREEIYGLTSQIRRAASGIPSNLAEGANRNSKSEYRRFVSIAKGSAGEVYYQLLLAKDLEYLKEEDFKRLRMEMQWLQTHNFSDRRLFTGFLCPMAGIYIQ